MTAQNMYMLMRQVFALRHICINEWVNYALNSDESTKVKVKVWKSDVNEESKTTAINRLTGNY